MVFKEINVSHNYTENPKDDTNKKTAKIEITIKPQHGTELRSGIKVRKIKREQRQLLYERKHL